MAVDRHVEGKIAVWFSCGVASAVAAKLILEEYGSCDVCILNNPILEEDSDNIRFLHDVEQWLQHPIEFVRSSKFPSQSCKEVWSARKFMSGIRGAPCTIELKKKARQEWELLNTPDWHVLGFTVDEISRYERFILTERSNVIPILINKGLTKVDCIKIIASAGLKLPLAYRLGYPNANCIGCVKATSATYWNLVRETYPKVYEERSIQSRFLGVKLVRYKGKRMFLDELPLDAKGRSLKNFSVDCGIFCEED